MDDSDESWEETLRGHGALDQLLFEDDEIPDMEWYLANRSIVFECGHLTDEGKCGEYERRPSMCSTFECQVLRGEEELDEFLEKSEPKDLDDEDLVEITDRVNQIIREEALETA